jgi:hypothetical protein
VREEARGGVQQGRAAASAARFIGDAGAP